MRQGLLGYARSLLFGDKSNAKTLAQEYDTHQIRAAWESWIINNYMENPDKVLERHGKNLGIELYDEMMRIDPIIGSHCETRKLAVLSKPIEILPIGAPDNVVQMCKDALANIENLEADLGELLEAVPKGFAVGEIIWEVVQGKWLPKTIHGRNQSDYVFGVNRELRLRTKAKPTDGEEVPPFKFIVHSHDVKKENRYGTAVLQRLYWPYWYKKNAWKFWAMAVERFGMPIIQAAVTGALNSDQKKALEEFMNSIQSRSWIYKPSNVTLDTLEPKNGSSDNYYSPFMDYCDKMSVMVILGQQLSTTVADTGARSLGDVHNQVKSEYTASDANELSATLTRDLITPVVRLNLSGYTGPMPKAHIKAEPEANLSERIKIDQTAQSMGKQIPIRYMVETYGIPEPENNEPILERPANPMQALGFSEPSNKVALEQIAVREGRGLFASWPERINRLKKN